MRINSGYVATPSPLQPPYHVGKYVNASAIPSHIWTFWADCPPKIILAFIKTWCARFGLLGNYCSLYFTKTKAALNAPPPRV